MYFFYALKTRRMQKLYFFTFLFTTFLFAGCSKDFLKRYEDRIEGVWQLTDVDRLGWGGNTSGVTFRDGLFTFSENGGLEYTSTSGQVYQGSWDLRRNWVRGQCYTNEDGYTECDDRYVRSMHITAVDFANQDIRSEYFDEILFTGTNRFKAYIYTGSRSYVFRFKRQ
jgi:hypothetical protein